MLWVHVIIAESKVVPLHNFGVVAFRAIFQQLHIDWLNSLRAKDFFHIDSRL